MHTGAPEVFARLDFDDDGAFLEPMAFALAAAGAPSTADLELVYAGAISPGQRLELDTATDDAGRVFLPGIGFLSGLPPFDAVRLIPSEAVPLGYTAAGWDPIGTLLSEWRVGDPGPSLIPYAVRAVAERVAVEGGRLSDVSGAARSNRDTLERAVGLLTEVWPLLGVMIQGVVRHIVLFDDPEQNSFAAPAMHGIAFLNVRLGQSVAFFVEDLAHQCGHVLFTAAWEGLEPPLTVPSETPVAESIGSEDHRTLEVALHGMTTQALMVTALDRLSRSTAAAADDRAEAKGRMLFALVRLGLDLRRLAGLDVYSPSGAALLRELVGTYADIATRYDDALATADFGDQPYNFDYEIYRSRNPVVCAQVRS